MLFRITTIAAAVIMLAITLRFFVFPTLGKRRAMFIFAAITTISCAFMVVYSSEGEGDLMINAVILAAAAFSIIFTLYHCLSAKFTAMAAKNSSNSPNLPQIKTCKHCGASVPPYSDSCPLCGGQDFDIKYGSSEVYDNSIPVHYTAEEEREGKRCPSCGQLNTVTDRFCSRCGKPLI